MVPRHVTAGALLCFNSRVEPVALSVTLLEPLLARIAHLEALLAAQDQRLALDQAEIARLLSRLADREAELAALRADKGSRKTPKNSRNSSLPPGQEVPPNRTPDPASSAKKGPPDGHPGKSRHRSEPSHTVTCRPSHCSRCGADLSLVPGHLKKRSQQIELPPLSPDVVEVLCYRCFCPECGGATTASYPEGFDPKQTFGPRLQMAIAYLHHHHHVGCERLARLLQDLWGLSISEGAIVNAVSRVKEALREPYEAAGQKVRESKVVGSDETRQRVCGQNWWEWTVQSEAGAYHWIAHSRAGKQLQEFFEESVPEVQVSDCYSAQLASPVAIKQVCQAHQLRNLLEAKEQGDTEYAPKMSRLIRMAIGLAHRREKLRAELYAHQAARLKRLGHEWGFGPWSSNVFGEALQRRYRQREASWWVFLERADVPPTNNASERALRPAVIHRKVTGGFRSEWGAEAYASFLSVVQTLQREGADLFTSLLSFLKPHDLARPAPASDA